MKFNRGPRETAKNSGKYEDNYSVTPGGLSQSALKRATSEEKNRESSPILEIVV
jgi:hypothetical protein